MPLPRIIRFADCPPLPWKNGSGRTRELWALRDGAGATLVRISIAEIDGAQDFSRFPDIDRVILQLDGPPMVLTIDGTPHPMTREVPLAFPGEAMVSCALNGEARARDLNLMCRRGAYIPTVERVVFPRNVLTAIGKQDCIYGLIALASCRILAPFQTDLQPCDLLMADAPLALRTESAAAFIALAAIPAG